MTGGSWPKRSATSAARRAVGLRGRAPLINRRTDGKEKKNPIIIYSRIKLLPTVETFWRSRKQYSRRRGNALIIGHVGVRALRAGHYDIHRVPNTEDEKDGLFGG